MLSTPTWPTASLNAPCYAIAPVSFAIFGLWRYIYNYGMFPYVNKVTLFVNNVPLPIFCVCIPHIGVSAVALKFCRDINGS